MHADCGPSSAAPRAEAAGAPSPFRALLRRGAGAVPRPVVVSAPMAEITDAAYRVMAFEAGADACWTEMVSAAGLTHGSAASPLLLLPLPEERGRPLVAQLYGSNPAEMAEAVRIVSDLGIFDAIDLNAGCPAPKVVRTGGGAALLRNLPLYGALIAAAGEALHSVGLHEYPGAVRAEMEKRKEYVALTRARYYLYVLQTKRK